MTPRAPLNGLITVSGGTFSRGIRVRVGGRIATVVNRSSRELRVRVPGGTSGGQVRVTDGARSAACGTLIVER